MKIAIIGAGQVGTVAAYCAAKAHLGEVVLIDVVKGLPTSKAIDLQHGNQLLGANLSIGGSNEYGAMEGADLVIHTAGLPRKPSMDRMDLLKINVEIAVTAGQAIARYAPQATIISVANPLDVIVMALYRTLGCDPRKIMGMAGTLDSTRYRWFIAEKLGVCPSDVKAMVLGGHGDTMVPLPRYTTVGGIPVTDLLSPEDITKISKRTQTGGGEIVGYLKTGSAFYAPGASVARLAEAICTNSRRLEAVSVLLTGEYGHRGIFLGVPAIIGTAGVVKIVELPLNDEERSQLDNSAAHVEEGIVQLDSLKI